MKKFSILCIFQIMIIFLFAGCSNDVTPIKTAKVLISGGLRAEACLIIINENGTVDYISCKEYDVDIHNEDTIKDYKKKTIRLSSKNKTIINGLIEEVLTNDPIEQLSVLDVDEIMALIDDKIYESTYDFYNYRSFDEDLANLAYKLVELSPIKVGGKDNPLRVPNQ